MNSRKLRPTQADNTTYSALVPGQHVVCINDRWTGPVAACCRLNGVVLPKKSNVYTIRDTIASPVGIGVRLEEIRNPVCPFSNGAMEPAFRASAFRPLPRLKVEDFMSANAPHKDKRVPA